MRRTEEAIIDFIYKKFKNFRKIKKGIGDDCAILDDYAITKDIYIEGTHFTKLLEPKAIGWRTFAGALSDIAAVGGEPFYFLFGIGLPQDYDEKFFRALIQGIKELSDMFKVQVIGGDTVKSEKIVLSYTVIGRIKKPIYRIGAKENDNIYITGNIGGSRLGYEFNLKNEKFLFPIPRIKEIKNILKKYKINSMIDISDGLVLDSIRVSNESNVRFNLFSNLIPLNKEAIDYCKKNNLNPVEFCINSGEEYEILFTSPEKINMEGIRMIGFVSKGKGVYLDNRKIKHRGFKHFDED